MDSETMTSQKREQRRRLRARRAETYGGQDGAARRARESLQLLDHAAPLVALIERLVADAPAAPPRGAAYPPPPPQAVVLRLARRLAVAGARVVFPAAAGDELDWISWDGISAFRDSPGRGFGKEPDGERLGPRALADAVLVLAPAVAVDRSATRIGHGAGYYDRALACAPASAREVAEIHPDELLVEGTLPRGEHDVPIPSVLTADGLVSLVTSTRT